MVVSGKNRKRQTTWSILKDVELALDLDRLDKGFNSIPALVNYILKRYTMGETIKGLDPPHPNISQHKEMTSWRILEDVLQVLEQDRVEKGFSSIPALANFLLKRYIMGETIKR